MFSNEYFPTSYFTPDFFADSGESPTTTTTTPAPTTTTTTTTTVEPSASDPTYYGIGVSSFRVIQSESAYEIHVRGRHVIDNPGEINVSS